VNDNSYLDIAKDSYGHVPIPEAFFDADGDWAPEPGVTVAGALIFAADTLLCTLLDIAQTLRTIAARMPD
jgi:hypothetical protein